jgi:hypothetical protein
LNTFGCLGDEVSKVAKWCERMTWPHERPETHFTSHRLLLNKSCCMNSNDLPPLDIHNQAHWGGSYPPLRAQSTHYETHVSGLYV